MTNIVTLIICSIVSELEQQFQEKVYYENVPQPFNYTMFDFLIQPTFNDSVYCPHVPVFYIIRSHPNRTDERAFIRSTWASNLRNSVVSYCCCTRQLSIIAPSQTARLFYRFLRLVDPGLLMFTEKFLGNPGYTMICLLST